MEYVLRVSLVISVAPDFSDLGVERSGQRVDDLVGDVPDGERVDTLESGLGFVVVSVESDEPKFRAHNAGVEHSQSDIGIGQVHPGGVGEAAQRVLRRVVHAATLVGLDARDAPHEHHVA